MFCVLCRPSIMDIKLTINFVFSTKHSTMNSFSANMNGLKICIHFMRYKADIGESQMILIFLCQML